MYATTKYPISPEHYQKLVTQLSIDQDKIQVPSPDVKNIILVHGAFVNVSGWQGRYQILTKKRYNDTVMQNSLASLEADVPTLYKAIKRARFQQFTNRTPNFKYHGN